MARKLMLGFIGSVVALVVLAPSAFAQSGGGCQLQGTASFTPGAERQSQGEGRGLAFRPSPF